MSADPTFDRHATELLRVSTRNTARYPGDPEWTDEVWERKFRVLLQLIYRAGAQAGLTHQFGRLDTTIERVRWLTEHDLVGVDVSELLREIENLQEIDRSLLGSYGITDGAIKSMIAEGLHTAFRKASDSPESRVIHRLIDGMPHDEWRAIVEFVAVPLIDLLREAEEAAKTAGQAPSAWPMDDPELVDAMMRWAMSKGAVITRHWFGLAEQADDQENTI